MPTKHEMLKQATDRTTNEIDALAEVLRTDPAAHALNVRELALRLYVRGVRAARR